MTDSERLDEIREKLEQRREKYPEDTLLLTNHEEPELNGLWVRGDWVEHAAFLLAEVERLTEALDAVAKAKNPRHAQELAAATLLYNYTTRAGREGEMRG